MNIPLTQFAGWLKQIDGARLSPEAQAALSRALPHFWPAEPPFPAEEVKARAVEQLGAFDENRMRVTLQKGPNRRYSGGQGLPRQRYYTLSRNNVGDDNLTLMAEMRAYRSCRRHRQICTILDSRYPPGQRLLQAEGIPDPDNNTLILVFLDDAGDALARTLITFPYTVSETTIPRVLDLRLLEAQQWFFNTFYLEKGNASHYPIPDYPVNDFADLLPFITTMELGGGGYTESIGWFLRRNHVDALIYPSARNEFWAYQENRRLVDWAGWCLVDYREATIPDAPIFDLGEQTPFIFPPPTRIIKWDGPRQGSWAAEGIRQLYRYRYFVELSNTFGETRSGPLIDALLQLEGGADAFWKFADEYKNPLP